MMWKVKLLFEQPVGRLVAYWMAAFFLSIMFALVNAGKASLNFELKSQAYSKAQVFWDAGSGFSEKESISLYVRPGNNLFHNITNAKMKHVSSFRIDPLKFAGQFTMELITVNYLDCLLPYPIVCNTKLHVDHAIKDEIGPNIGNNINYIFKSQGGDPKFSWWLESPRLRMAIVIVLNSIWLILIFTIIWLCSIKFSTRSSQVNNQLAKLATLHAFPLLLLYPFICLGYFLISQFLDVSSFNLQLFYGSLIIYTVVTLVSFFEAGGWQYTFRLLGLFVVLSLLAPEFLFHFGLLKTWPLGRREIPEYHWQLGRGFDDNFQHSSLKYVEEIATIGDNIPAGSIFLSDSATSYYLTSQINVFMRNPMQHHYIDGYSVDSDLITNLCHDEMSNAELEKVRTSLHQFGIKFVILNIDKRNKNLSSCLNYRYEIVERNIKHFSKKIIDGKNLLVYQL